MPIDAGKLQARGIYETRAPLGSLLDDLNQIARLIEEIAVLKKKIRQFALFSALAGLASAIAAGALTNTALKLVSLFAFTFCLVLFIYSLSYGSGLHKHGDRLVILKDLTGTIQRDADLKSRCSVRLAFTSQPKLVREEGWAGRNNGRQLFFADEFLSVQGELLDGSTIIETVSELTRRRSHKNRNGRTKTKIRTRYLVTLRFVYPDTIYGDVQSASAALNERVLVPPFATLRDIRVTEKAITVKALVRSKQDIAQTSAMLCLGAYRILNLARRVTAGGAQRKS